MILLPAEIGGAGPKELTTPMTKGIFCPGLNHEPPGTYREIKKTHRNINSNDPGWIQIGHNLIKKRNEA